jgi:hypothetical protein
MRRHAERNYVRGRPSDVEGEGAECVAVQITIVEDRQRVQAAFVVDEDVAAAIPDVSLDHVALGCEGAGE